MAYNIILFTKANPHQPLFLLDLGEEEVKRRFVTPLQTGDVIAFGAHEVSPDTIEKVEITFTIMTSREELPTLNAQQLDSSEASKWPEVRFASSGVDVTEQFVAVHGQYRGFEDSKGQYPREKTVFVAYGRDESKRLSLFRFLWAIGLRPLEWGQAANATGRASPPTMEVIQAGMQAAQAMIILLTPDDEARLRERFRKPTDPATEVDLTGQARQNVVFEAGMAWAIDPRRTVLTQIGTVRPFSDLAGINFVKLDNSAKRRHEYVARLRLAGCQVDDSGTDWLTTSVADFERDEVDE